MANEISFNATLSANKNLAGINRPASSSLDMSGSQMVQQTQTITTASWQAIDLGNISGNPKKLMIENLDTTNYVEIAEDNAGAHKQDKILATDFVLRSPVGTIYAKANGGSVLIAVTAVEA